MENPNIRKLVMQLVIEIAIYAVLVVGYFFVVLRFLGKPLETLFGRSLPAYAFLGLLLIVAQGILLEALTSLIIRQVGLGKRE